MSEEITLDVKKIVKRGGSYTVTIPIEVCKLLQLGEGDWMQFTYNPKIGRIYILKMVGGKGMTVGGTTIDIPISKRPLRGK